MKHDKKQIINTRSNAAAFLVFSMQSDVDSIEVRYEDENLWLK